MGEKRENDRRGIYRIDLVGDGSVISIMFEAALTKECTLGLLKAVRKAGNERAAEAARAFMECGGVDFSGFCMHEEFLGVKEAMGRADIFLHGTREAADALAGGAERYFLCMDCLLKEAGRKDEGCFLAARRSPEGEGFRWDVAGQKFISGDGFTDRAFPAFRSAGAGEGFRDLKDPLPVFPCFGCVDMVGVLMEMERHVPLSPRRALKAAVR